MKNLLGIKEEVTAYLEKKDIKAFFGDNIPSQHQQRYFKFKNLQDYDAQLLKEYFRIFKFEFEKYSKKFLKKIEIKSVNFVKELNVDNSGTKKFIPISATVDPESSSLVLDINHLPPNEGYDRQCIHHELFHLIDFNLNGTFRYNDPKWLMFNSDHFEYGNGGWTAYFDTDFKNKKHPQKGFVSEYAMRSIEEDRAETFMYMMMSDLRNDLENWIKEDEVLKRKVEYIKNTILNN